MSKVNQGCKLLKIIWGKQIHEWKSLKRLCGKWIEIESFRKNMSKVNQECKLQK